MNSNLDNFPIVNDFKTPSRDLNSQNHTDTFGVKSVRGDTLSQNWGQNLTSEDIEEMRNLILSCYYFKDIDNFFMNEKNLNKYIDKDILKINKTLSHHC